MTSSPLLHGTCRPHVATHKAQRSCTAAQALQPGSMLRGRSNSSGSRMQGAQEQQQQQRGATACHAVPLPEALTAGLFAGSTLYTAALGLLMVAAPQWRRTQQLMRPLGVLLPLALAYGLLLGCSWEPDTFSLILPGSLEEGLKGGFNPQFFPELRGIMALFSRLVTAASLWVHLLAINLFAARAVYLQGLAEGVPTRHSILLCLTLSPLGLLTHFATKAVWRRRAGGGGGGGSPAYT